MESIGGYLELELNKENTYHKNALKLNSGRNAFEYILLANEYKKIYIPYYTCDVILEPLLRNQIEYEFYSVDDNLDPIFNFDKVNENTAFLYTNYFGIKDLTIHKLNFKNENIIIDNAQSFYSEPTSNLDTFYSPRKFFGLPDGGLVYCKKKIDIDISDENSINRMSHLLKRIEFGPEMSYTDFLINEKSLCNQHLCKMSKLTRRLYENIDFIKIKNKRLQNFEFLHNFLKNKNLLHIDKNDSQVPMVYPFQSKNKDLQRILLENKVYTAKYWPNVKKWSDDESLENKLLKEITFLPLDQRYSTVQLQKIINIIKNEI